jgi:hypothetical protein
MKDNDIFLSSLTRALKRDNGHGSCSVHGPLLIYPLEEDAYATVCLSCGVIGPEREDGWEAKLAFDESFRPAS